MNSELIKMPFNRSHFTCLCCKCGI